MPKKAKASSRPEQFGIIIPDTHFPEHDTVACAVACEAIRLLKPNILCHLGDVGEWDSVSRWRWSRQKRPPLKWLVAPSVDSSPGLLDLEAAAVNEGLDQIDAACDEAGVTEKMVTLGNHDDWLTRFCQEFEHVEDKCNPVAIMRLKQRGYRVHPFDADEIPRLGRSRLHVYHGHHAGGQYHAAAHLRNMQCNVAYGHHHDVQTHSLRSLEGPRQAWSLGCLRTLKKTFLKGKPNNWQHCIGFVHILPSRNFQLQACTIIDGQTRIEGHTIDGNEIAKEKAA